MLIFWPAIDGAWKVAVVDPDWPHQDRSINEANDMVREMFSQYIKNQVGDDEELLAKVMPIHALMDKHMLQALKRDNVN